MAQAGDYRGCVSGSKRGIDRAWGWIENDEVKAMVDAHPDRFIGVAAIDATGEQEALADIDRAIGLYGFKAVAIEPGTHATPMYADDKRLYPSTNGAPSFRSGLPPGRGQRRSGHELLGPEPRGTRPHRPAPPEVVVLHGGWPW
jgi:predicted TIM-barrel fold metal-dependent hydrolase